MVSSELEAVTKREAEVAQREETTKAQDIKLQALSESLKVSSLNHYHHIGLGGRSYGNEGGGKYMEVILFLCLFG